MSVNSRVWCLAFIDRQISNPGGSVAQRTLLARALFWF